MGVLEWALLGMLSLLWGGSFFFVGIAVTELPTLSIVTLRVGLGALVLWAVIVLTGRRIPRAGTLWAAFLGMGLMNNAVPFVLIVWGQQTISSGLASILNATTPLFTVIIAGFIVADERMSVPKLAGVGIGLAGVTVMLGIDAASGLVADIQAQSAVLGASLSYALAGVFGRRFKRLGIDPIVTAAGQVTASTILLAPVAIFVDRPWSLPVPSTATWSAIVALAVLSTALAYVLYFQILARAGATNLLLVTLLIPVSAIVLGAVVLNESLRPAQFVGMALIGAGLVFMDGRLIRRRPAPGKYPR
ncbi:MAG: DMT family transporter [Alphaproteobacteria bacterium]|nr:MAG: DMT family transporter [Alphaproteobacteria bacterium]